jgi:hypothetical protein
MQFKNWLQLGFPLDRRHSRAAKSRRNEPVTLERVLPTPSGAFLKQPFLVPINGENVRASPRDRHLSPQILHWCAIDVSNQGLLWRPELRLLRRTHFMNRIAAEFPRLLVRDWLGEFS